jgi:hypothetical protein
MKIGHTTAAKRKIFGILPTPAKPGQFFIAGKLPRFLLVCEDETILSVMGKIIQGK